jgi:hypothetical protein
MVAQYFRQVAVDIISPSSSKTTRIDNLRVSFKIEKTPDSEPNKGDITIYNLSEKTRSIFEEKQVRIALYAGYIGTNPSPILRTNLFSSKEILGLFKGNVKKFEHAKEGPDILTKIECGDGDDNFIKKTFDKGYPPNTNLRTVFSDLSNALGLPNGSQIEIPDQPISNGACFSGMVRDHLDNICNRFDLEWSIQDEGLQIVEKNGFTQDGIVFLNSQTGLVGSPKKTKDGIEFNCLLQPVIKPGRRVKIESMFFNGNFIARNVYHDGDSHQGDFLTRCEAKKYGQ